MPGQVGEERSGLLTGGWTPLRKPVLPVRISARLGMQRGFAHIALVNVVPCFTRVSKCGVSMRVLPSAPIVSGRWSSEMMNRMFGWSSAPA